MFKTFIFCQTDCCTDTFESEEDLNMHILLDQHTIKKSSFRTVDKAKLMLFEKIKTDNASSSILQTTTTTSINTPLTRSPRYYEVFNSPGWALRIRKPVKRIDKAIKEFLKSIFEEEKLYGKIYRITKFLILYNYFILFQEEKYPMKNM
jgi:hypothetical protein